MSRGSMSRAQLVASGSRSIDAHAALQQWFVLVVLLAIIACATALAFGREVYDLYVWEFVAPRLQQELGFRIGVVKVTRDDSSYDVPGIVAVEPGGTFDQAGFQPGDIPIGYVHGFVSFYHHLNSARGKVATLHILRPEDGGDWKKRRVRAVAIPSRATPHVTRKF